MGNGPMEELLNSIMGKIGYYIPEDFIDLYPKEVEGGSLQSNSDFSYYSIHFYSKYLHKFSNNANSKKLNRKQWKIGRKH